MSNLYNLKGIVRLKCRLDCLFLHINDTRCDEDTIFLNMNRDLFLQHDDNVCQDVGNNDIKFFRSGFFLKFCITRIDSSIFTIYMMERDQFR